MLVPRVTLGDVAEAVGLSRSGASRALRNDPRVPRATCLRVQRMAARLGYRPDPELSSALRLLRTRKAERYVETLAYFSWHSHPIEEGGNHYTKRLYHGAVAHADALGYRLEEYWTNSPGMSPRRLQTILVSRGIRGCLVGPITQEIARFDFDWSLFSVVAATAAFDALPLDRARSANYENTRLALAEVRALGYRRVGLLVDDYINARSSHAIRAAYLDDQLTRNNPPIPVFETAGLGPDPGGECLASPQCARFRAWLRKHRPDVILSSRVVFHRWLTASGKTGFVSLEGVNVGQDISHIDQHPERVGAAGVDLLISKLHHKSRGVSREPIIVQVLGSWSPGATTRLQPKRAKDRRGSSSVDSPS